MKKFVVLLAIVAASFVGIGAPAIARASSVTDPYTFHQKGISITVDYTCAGFGAELSGNKIGTVVLPDSPTAIGLDAEMDPYGVGLTIGALDHLAIDQSNTVC